MVSYDLFFKKKIDLMGPCSIPRWMEITSLASYIVVLLRNYSNKEGLSVYKLSADIASNPPI